VRAHLIRRLLAAALAINTLVIVWQVFDRELLTHGVTVNTIDIPLFVALCVYGIVKLLRGDRTGIYLCLVVFGFQVLQLDGFYARWLGNTLGLNVYLLREPGPHGFNVSITAVIMVAASLFALWQDSRGYTGRRPPIRRRS